MDWKKYIPKLSFWNPRATRHTAQQPQEGEREFVFYWYKQTVIKNTRNEIKKSFTMPFRTKVYAKSFDEAKEKLINFALSKTELIILTEQEWKEGGTEIEQFMKEFDALNDKFSNLFMKRSFTGFSSSNK